MKRANCFNIKCRSLFKQCLNGAAVFANDVKIISSCLASPILFNIKRTEFAEAVCREKHFFTAFICYHNLRPMHHGRHNKIKRMFAEGKGIAFLNRELFNRRRYIKKLRQHCKGFCIADKNSRGIFFRKILDICSMIGFQMGNHKIIRLPAAERGFKICKPFVCFSCVHSIHNRNFFVHNNI